MTRDEAPSVGIREIARRWPLILIPVMIAVAAAIWSVSQQRPTYTATTQLELAPLVQWDETFLGTSLVRDGGDAKRTATTMAALLDSREAATATAEYLGSGWTPESVDDAIKVAVVQNANVIDIVSHTSDPDSAIRVSEGFAKATLEDRWRTIAVELDARIATLTAAVADSTSDEAATRLKTLTVIRESGADPTLRMGPTSPAAENARQALAVVLALAAAGGLFIGVLAAFLMARLRRRQHDATSAEPTPIPDKAPALSPNGGS